MQINIPNHWIVNVLPWKRLQAKLESPKKNWAYPPFPGSLPRKNKTTRPLFTSSTLLKSTFLTTAKFERLPIPKQIEQVGFFPCANCICHKNGYFNVSYLFLSNPKTNCWFGTIDAFLVVTVKMFYTYIFAITVTFSILDKLKI